MKFLLGLVFGLAIGGVVAAAVAVMNPVADGPIAARDAMQPVAPETGSEPETPNDTSPEDEGAAAPQPAVPAAPAGPVLDAPTAEESGSAAIGGENDTGPARLAAAPTVGIAAPASDIPALDTASIEAPEVLGEGVGEATAALVPGNALEENAVAFAADDARPLMAIILLDKGENPALRTGLTALSTPITFGVAAGLDDARDLAVSYRESGFEVVAVIPETGPLRLDAGTDPAAVASILGRAFDAVPVATALMDGIDGPLPRERRLADEVLEALKVTGHGLLTHRSTGLNNMPLIADEAGVPSEVVFRVIDAIPEATEIALALERAALDASRGGSVIVVGHLRQETVSTLISWMLGAATDEVSIAPVSAVLR